MLLHLIRYLYFNNFFRYFDFFHLSKPVKILQNGQKTFVFLLWQKAKRNSGTFYLLLFLFVSCFLLFLRYAAFDHLNGSVSSG